MPVVSNVTCPVCGSLCDDVELTIENNRITKVKNACAVGEAKFLAFADPHHRRVKPLIRKNGELVEASLDEAIRRSAEILAEATYPLLYGWSSTSTEAIRVGLELAEEVGGVIDNTSTVCHGPSIQSIQNVGIPTCTLGQIRHRADLVVYWGSNPWSAHPRHLERYTTFTDGRFQENIWIRYITKIRALIGRKKARRAAKLVSPRSAFPPKPERKANGLPPTLTAEQRKMVVVDVRKTRSAEIADYFLQVKPNMDYELLQAFRTLINDRELDVDKVAGVPVELLEEVADILVGCRFGVFFFGLGLTMSSAKIRNIDAAISLTKELNKKTKFTIMPMRGHFNVTGANVAFTWQTGYPYAVDLSQGFPRYNPGETSAVDILSRRDSDAALVIASDPVSHFPKNAVKSLLENPLIVIDPQVTPTSSMAEVVIPSAFVGIETEGTAYRMDHVPLPLKKVVEPPETCLPDEMILRKILKEVRKLKGRKGS